MLTHGSVSQLSVFESAQKLYISQTKRDRDPKKALRGNKRVAMQDLQSHGFVAVRDEVDAPGHYILCVKQETTSANLLERINNLPWEKLTKTEFQAMI